MTPTSRVLVVGLGNTLLRDEGVGVHAVEAVRERYEVSPEVQLLDGGTMGLDLLGHFQGRERVLIVDAVDLGAEPGKTAVLEGDEIPAALGAPLSVHHIGLSDVLFALRLQGRTPPVLCLVGVQPEAVEPGLELTETLRRGREAAVRLVADKLREWNLSCALRLPPGS